MATTLSAGDIAIVGYITNGSPDSFSFVNLVPIGSGTVIYFTDNGWTGTQFRCSSATDGDGNENLIRFTAISDIPAGTVIRSIDTSANYTWAKSGQIGTTTAGSYADLSLSQSGEQITAFQSTNTNNPLNSGFTAIYQIDNTGTFENATTASEGNIITGLSQSSNSAVLFNNTSATYAAFNLNILGNGTRLEWLAAINNSSNWTFSNLTALPTGSITVSSGTPTVNLSLSSNTGTEAGTTVITVTATASSAVSGNQSVNLGVTGTGIDSGDYTLSNTTITIPNGSTTGSVTFTVANDALVEGTETATLTISSPTSGIALGTTTTQDIAIADNDVPALPTVNLSVSANAGTEAGTTIITVTATASSAVSGNQTVTLGVSGTNITTSDYYLSNSTITIPNGQTTGSVRFIIADDAVVEGTETAILTISSPSAGLSLGTTTTENITITNNSNSFLTKVGGATSANGAEIPAFDPGSDRLFVVACTTVDIYIVSNTGSLTAAGTLTPNITPPMGTTLIPNSVAVNNGVVAVAYAVRETSTGVQQTGKVAFFTASDGSFIHSVDVGALPDMLIFTPDGTKILVANEGEPNSYNQADSVDPEGSVSIIDIAGGVADATVQTATFTSFNSQIATLKAAGVRIYGPNATVAQDLEPEYITVSGDGTKAWVTLQENNAIAVLDIATATITDILPLGAKDYNLPGNGIDASDRDVDGTAGGGGKINIQNWPVFGLYQPDAITSFTVAGQTYYITANEGDSRNYTGFNEEIRVGGGSYILDLTTFSNAATLKQLTNLGRLQLTNATGDTDGDGDIDRIESLGARSFSIWNASGTQVFDSGDQLEQITATKVPTIFNSDGTAATFDTRSDNKGPEPEGVVVGVINGRTYAFIGSERTGDVFVYDVSNPSQPTFVQHINTPEDVAIEGLTFVSAADSPTSKPLLITANEVSNTVAVFEISVVNQAPSDIVLSSNTITENTVIGTGVKIGDITITDFDATGNNNVLSFGGTDAANFEIRNDTELFFIGTSLDFEAKKSYSITLTSTDANGGTPLTYSKAFTVDVLDLSEITGGAANDVLVGKDGVNEYIVGSEGNDALYGLSGNDTLIGGAGNNTANYSYATSGVNINLTTGVGQDGQGGTDTLIQIQNLIGSNFDDVVTGDANANTLNGKDGNDTINGLGGNDILIGEKGNNTLNGGDGIDTADYRGASTGVVVNLLTGEVTTNGYGGADDLSGIENVSGSDKGNDNITGDNLANNLLGNAGNDTLIGLGGNDRLDGGTGADSLVGGTGDDSYSLDNVGDKILENASEGNDTVLSTTSYVLGDNLEILSLKGTAVNGTGNALDNSVIGNASNNLLNGGAGNDRIDGNAGNDTLTGGSGRDDLTGGLGNDRFDFRTLGNSVLGNNLDIIRDFNAANDKFLVSNAPTSFTDAGTVLALTQSGISANLTTENFAGLGDAAQFKFGNRTFVAINDGTVGFQSANDALIELTTSGLVGTLTIASFVV